VLGSNLERKPRVSFSRILSAVGGSGIRDRRVRELRRGRHDLEHGRPTTAATAATTTAPAPTTTGTIATVVPVTTSSPSGANVSGIAEIPAQDRSPAGTSGKAPTVVVPAGNPPTQLEMTDLITGTGPLAEDGDSIEVQYVLATYSSRKVVQSSWTSNPFTFTLGEGQVIPGWDKRACGSVGAAS
jgi:peptidylprolyl isomerase